MLELTDIVVIASGSMLGYLGFYTAYIVGNKIAERIERKKLEKEFGGGLDSANVSLDTLRQMNQWAKDPD